VGWATFHRAERNYDVAVTATLSQVVTIKAKSAEEAEQKAVAALEEAVNEHNLTFPIGIELDECTADAQLSAE
jgi:predicted RNase H-like HicB family nuclease